MGLFDNMQSALNRGTAAAGRTGRSARLKLQLSELGKQRRDLAAQLGASLYDIVKDDEELRQGRESVIDDIADIDRQRASIEEQLSQIEAEAAAAREAALAVAEPEREFTCPNCGAKVPATYKFCTGCGTPIEEIRKVASVSETSGSGRRCVSCGAPLEEGDLFCIACGARQPDDEMAAETVGDSE